jgi:hypothetical protein
MFGATEHYVHERVILYDCSAGWSRTDRPEQCNCCQPGGKGANLDGQLALIVGEPRLGKSHLIEEFIPDYAIAGPGARPRGA